MPVHAWGHTVILKLTWKAQSTLLTVCTLTALSYNFRSRLTDLDGCKGQIQSDGRIRELDCMAHVQPQASVGVRAITLRIRHSNFGVTDVMKHDYALASLHHT